MYQFYNCHPKGLLVGDCVKRAISLAANMDYHQVQLELNRYKKVTGAKSFNSDYNPHKYVEKVLHGIKMSFPAVAGERRMTAGKFSETYTTGSYILNMAGHWSCCIDGVIYDTWDCSDKCVYTAYKLSGAKRSHKPQLTESMLTSCITTHALKSDPSRIEVKIYDRFGDKTTKKINKDEFEYYVNKMVNSHYTHYDLDKKLLEAKF